MTGNLRPAAGRSACVSGCKQATRTIRDMSGLDDLLDRLEHLLAAVEELDEPARQTVFDLLDGIDTIHRLALHRLASTVGTDEVRRLRSDEPAVAWLFDAYGIGVDEVTAAEQALETIRPYVHSHGGRVELVDASEGVVRVRMSGSCSGCSASAVTLEHGIEEALREHLPGFVRVESEPDTAPRHPPPGPTLVEIGPRPSG